VKISSIFILPFGRQRGTSKREIGKPGKRISASTLRLPARRKFSVGSQNQILFRQVIQVRKHFISRLRATATPAKDPDQICGLNVRVSLSLYSDSRRSVQGFLMYTALFDPVIQCQKGTPLRMWQLDGGNDRRRLNANRNGRKPSIYAFGTRFATRHKKDRKNSEQLKGCGNLLGEAHN
jgi:hypothetical protein